MKECIKRPPQRPPSFVLCPRRIIEMTDEKISRSRSVREHIVDTIVPKHAEFQNVSLQLAYEEHEMLLVSRILKLFQLVSSDEQIRVASAKAELMITDFETEAFTCQRTFELLEAVCRKYEDDSTIHFEMLRLIRQDRKRCLDAGLAVPGGVVRDRFKWTGRRLCQLTTEFRACTTSYDDGIWVDAKKVKSFPGAILQRLRRGELGAGGEGKSWLCLEDENVFSILQHCKNEALRREVFMTYEKRCLSNVRRLHEIVLLRDERSRLLGHSSYAAFQIENSSARHPDVVMRFLVELQKILSPIAVAEVKELKQRKIQETGTDAGYYLWDHIYYSALRLDHELQDDPAEYFPLDVVVGRVLEIFGNLFGLDFVKCGKADCDMMWKAEEGIAVVWHPDVQLYCVWDDRREGGDFVGYLYLDLLTRPGKRAGAGNYNLQPGFTRKDGTRHYPSTAVVCNFGRPTSARHPTLLQHSQTVTLCHELGHAIHDLVSKTTFGRYHGISGPCDFVETPSQLLENWCWQPSFLKSLSFHWSYLSPEHHKDWLSESNRSQRPARIIPDSLIKAILNNRYLHNALLTLEQDKFSLSELFNRLRSSIVPIDGPECQNEGYRWGHGQATFSHVAEHYGASYYSYLWGRMLSDYLYYTCFEHDLENTEMGRAYRHSILEPGSSRDGASLLRDFLGCEPSVDPFLKEIAKTSPVNHICTTGIVVND